MKILTQIAYGFLFFLFPIVIACFIVVIKQVEPVYRLIHLHATKLNDQEQDMLPVAAIMYFVLLILITFGLFTNYWYLFLILLPLHFVPKSQLGVPQIKFIAIVHILVFLVSLILYVHFS